MRKLVQIFILGVLCFLMHSQTGFSQNQPEEKIKVRKLTYNDFMTNYSVNDTSLVIIQIFFDKKSNSAYGQMSFLPITLVLFAFPPTQVIGAGLTVISLPLFLNGLVTLQKYRKGKLLKVLVAYKESQTLPNWIRKKANRQLDYYKEMETEY